MTIWDEVAAERARAHAKHGDKSMEAAPIDDMLRLSILTEEVGEVAKALNDARSIGYLDQRELRLELIQVAAMAGAWADVLYPVCRICDGRGCPASDPLGTVRAIGSFKFVKLTTGYVNADTGAKTKDSDMARWPIVGAKKEYKWHDTVSPENFPLGQRIISSDGDAFILKEIEGCRVWAIHPRLPTPDSWPAGKYVEYND